MDRPENQRIKEARKNPYVLNPGDIVDVPGSTAAELRFTRGGTARYRTTIPKARLKLTLETADGSALASKRFELAIPGCKDAIRGTTDAKGNLDVPVPAHAMQGELRLFLQDDQPLTIPVRIGHLDPASTATGIGGRLKNLGYAVGDDAAGLAEAVRAFQRDQGLDETGELDEATREHIVNRHQV